jgi:hypothetical protein
MGDPVEYTLPCGVLPEDPLPHEAERAREELAWRLDEVEHDRDDLRREITEVRESLRRAGVVGAQHLSRAEAAEAREKALRELVGEALIACETSDAIPSGWVSKARAALAQEDDGQEEHKKHPAEDMCVFCRSQWPCEEAVKGE